MYVKYFQDHELYISLLTKYFHTSASFLIKIVENVLLQLINLTYKWTSHDGQNTLYLSYDYSCSNKFYKYYSSKIVVQCHWILQIAVILFVCYTLIKQLLISLPFETFLFYDH